MNTFKEEDYLKAIYQLSRRENDSVSTNSIANKLNTKASSVTDMLKKLAGKDLIHYKKYQGVTMTEQGRLTAVQIIRKHRLWEVFLVKKLNFKWDEVHEIAEELEHIDSEELVNRLEQFLDYPKFDPHGDPIPDREGNISHHKELTLADLNPGEQGIILGVKDSAPSFLQYLESQKLTLGTKVTVNEIFDYDNSLRLMPDQGNEFIVSQQVSKNLYIRKHLN